MTITEERIVYLHALAIISMACIVQRFCLRCVQHVPGNEGVGEGYAIRSVGAAEEDAVADHGDGSVSLCGVADDGWRTVMVAEVSGDALSSL